MKNRFRRNVLVVTFLILGSMMHSKTKHHRCYNCSRKELNEN